MAAAIFHDTGKLSTTVVHDDGKVTAHEHELASVEIFRDLGPRCFPRFTTSMLLGAEFMIRHHMRAKNMGEKKLNRLKEEAKDLTRRIGDREHAEDGESFDLWTNFQILLASDDMTKGPAASMRRHADNLKRRDKMIKSFDRTIHALHVNELKSRTREKLLAEREQN